jgi:hypothetical protein
VHGTSTRHPPRLLSRRTAVCGQNAAADAPAKVQHSPPVVRGKTLAVHRKGAWHLDAASPAPSEPPDGSPRAKRRCKRTSQSSTLATRGTWYNTGRASHRCMAPERRLTDEEKYVFCGFPGASSQAGRTGLIGGSRKAVVPTGAICQTNRPNEKPPKAPILSLLHHPRPDPSVPPSSNYTFLLRSSSHSNRASSKSRLTSTGRHLQLYRTGAKTRNPSNIMITEIAVIVMPCLCWSWTPDERVTIPRMRPAGANRNAKLYPQAIIAKGAPPLFGVPSSRATGALSTLIFSRTNSSSVRMPSSLNLPRRSRVSSFCESVKLGAGVAVEAIDSGCVGREFRSGQKTSRTASKSSIGSSRMGFDRSASP